MIRGNNITNSRGRVPNGTLWMRFNCCPNLMFLASPWLKIQIFKLIILPTLSSSKLIVFKINYLFIFTDFEWVMDILLSFCKMVGHENANSLPLTKTSRTTQRIWHKLFSMTQSSGINYWIPQLINRIQRFNLLFCSVTGNKLCIKRIKTTQKVLHDWGNLNHLNDYFLTVLWRAVFRTQPKVYGGAFLQK